MIEEHDLNGSDFNESDEWEEIAQELHKGRPKRPNPPKSFLDSLCRSKEDIQRTRIRVKNRLGACELANWEEPQLVHLRELLAHLLVEEDSLTRTVAGMVKNHPVYTGFLQSVKGIGETMAAPLLEYLDPHRKHVSCWYRYVGLDCDDQGDATRRKRGVKTSWNPYLKRHMYKIGCQFIKAKGFYGETYQRIKRELIARPAEEREIQRAFLWILEEPVGNVQPGSLLGKELHSKVAKLLQAEGRTAVKVRRRPLNIHLMAMRATVKLFLSHLYEKWREELGLPKDTTYPVMKGHTGYIPPPEPVDLSDQKS